MYDPMTTGLALMGLAIFSYVFDWIERISK
jgi:hypothetical protein